MIDSAECLRVEEQLALAGVGALEASELDSDVRRHLTVCPRCRESAASYAAVVAVLAEALQPVDPPLGVRRALMAQVYGDAAGSPAVRARPRLARLWHALPVSRTFTLVAGAAVVAAIALAAWGVSRGATAQASYQVSGTTADPNARGTLVYDPNVQTSTLVVHGLPGPDAAGGGDHVYEVWLIPANGPASPAGFLTLQPDGSTWVAVLNGAVPAYHTVAVTVEPPGGSATPTGIEVISGAV
jgi:anti-sigma-K factor RskA